MKRESIKPQRKFTETYIPDFIPRPTLVEARNYSIRGGGSSGGLDQIAEDNELSNNSFV